jgi:hypothetical protein
VTRSAQVAGGGWARLLTTESVALAAGIAGLLLSAGLLGRRNRGSARAIRAVPLRGALPSPPEVVVTVASAEALGLPAGKILEKMMIW